MPHARRATPVPTAPGDTFGRLTAVRPATRGGYPAWECVCACGRTTVVLAINLRAGHTRSCGCLAREWGAAVGGRNRRDLTGRVVGAWTVVGDSGRRSGRCDVLWVCRCACGVERAVNGFSLTRGTSRSCGGCRRAAAASSAIASHSVTSDDASA